MYSSNYVVTEIHLERETCISIYLYKSPSQDHDKFEFFCTNLDNLLGNIDEELPLCSTVTEDFNAWCSR